MASTLSQLSVRLAVVSHVTLIPSVEREMDTIEVVKRPHSWYLFRDPDTIDITVADLELVHLKESLRCEN